MAKKRALVDATLLVASLSDERAKTMAESSGTSYQDTPFEEA